MTQESIVLSTTPPFPGADAVAAINKANQALATDFAGAIDPAGLDGCGPYCTWADTGNMLRKRRNAADTAWVVEGPLFVNAGLGRLIKRTIITASQTFTYDAQTTHRLSEIWGGGGGGGGVISTAAGTIAVGAGAGSGAYSSDYRAVNGGSSVMITVGAAGAAGTASSDGGTGGTTSVGSDHSVTGGLGGKSSTGAGAYSNQDGGVGGHATGGNVNIDGSAGGISIADATKPFAMSGFGGAAPRGGGSAKGSAGPAAGEPGVFPGGGGAGAMSFNGSAAQFGGAGAAGLVIIWEFA